MSRWLPYVAVAALSTAATAFVTTVLLDRPAGGEAVREYLLANPEVIPEAMERLRGKQASAQIAANRAALETPFAGAWIGAEQPDVTVVQFFDYACGFCRASLPNLQRLVREDPKVRVVFRELPILGRDSEQAARVSLAAAEQGRYARFHDALYAAGRPVAQSIAAAADAAGLEPGRTQAIAQSDAVARELSQNVELARMLQFGGTPAWVIGDQALNGAVPYDTLKAAVAAARRRG
jgi:protein-disulfide isomerase